MPIIALRMRIQELSNVANGQAQILAETADKQLAIRGILSAAESRDLVNGAWIDVAIRQDVIETAVEVAPAPVDPKKSEEPIVPPASEIAPDGALPSAPAVVPAQTDTPPAPAEETAIPAAAEELSEPEQRAEAQADAGL